MRKDEPNLVVPLASSYNTRGIAAFTNNFTNALDQRKINAFYEPAVNPITGKTTLYLVKRGGVSIIPESYGTTGQVAYLVEIGPGGSPAKETIQVFSTSGNDVRAHNYTTTTTIVTAAGYVPTYVDKTHISGTENLVLQLRNSSFAQRVFYSTGIASWTEITDSDFTGLTLKGKMEFLDGYAFVLDSNSRIYNSDINSLSSWSASSYVAKQIQQDNPTALARLGKQIIAFGNSTMEVFRNAGNATGSPLVSAPDLFHEMGVIGNDVNVHGGTHYTATLDGKLYFKGIPAGFYAYDGQRVEKVSTPAIDKMLQTTIYSINRAGFGASRCGGIAITFDLTTAATQRCLVYIPEWKEWFEWNSTVFRPVSTWRNSHVFLGVGANQHKLYQFGSGNDNWQDSGTDYTWTHQFKIPRSGNHRKSMQMFSLVGDTARLTLDLGVEFSDDDYQTWSTARTIDMTSMKKAIYNCGSYRDRAVRLSYTGAREVRLEAAGMKIL